MHPAAHFRETDETRLLAQLAAQPFATICAAPEGRSLVAHHPMGRLIGATTEQAPRAFRSTS